MGLFDKIFGKGAKKSPYSYIAEIAALTAPDSGVSERLSSAFAEPYEYFIKVEYRFDPRGLVIGIESNETLFWVSLADELAAAGYLFEVPSECTLEKFTKSSERLKTYDTIKDAVSSAGLDENGSVEKWCADINRELGGKALLCRFDIGTDSFPLAVVSADVFPQIQKLASDNKRKVEKL